MRVSIGARGISLPVVNGGDHVDVAVAVNVGVHVHVHVHVNVGERRPAK